MTSKSRLIIGYIILGLGLAGFVIAAFVGSFNSGLISLLTSLILWLIVLNIGAIDGLSVAIGGVLFIFGVIISIGVFLSMGIQVTSLGSQVKIEVVAISLSILFFFILAGSVFIFFSNIEKEIKVLGREIKKLNTPR